jgi:hypothetical protein
MFSRPNKRAMTYCVSSIPDVRDYVSGGREFDLIHDLLYPRQAHRKSIETVSSRPAMTFKLAVRSRLLAALRFEAHRWKG